MILVGTILFSDRTKNLIGSYHWDFFCIGNEEMRLDLEKGRNKENHEDGKNKRWDNAKMCM